MKNKEKNEYKKRIIRRGSAIGLFCALALASGISLAACGKSNEPATTSPETTETSTEISTETSVETTETTTMTEETKMTETSVETSTETTQATETTESTVQLNEAEWVVDPDTGMLIDNSNFIVEDNEGVEHVMTRDQYMKWLKGEYSWE